MARASDQMKIIDAELADIREKIERFKAEEAVLVRLKARLEGGAVRDASAPRKRSISVKPLIIDIINKAGVAGMTSADVALLVKERVPDVAKDTVGSVLSRLKSEGAFVYQNDRYYERQFAPRFTFGGMKDAL